MDKNVILAIVRQVLTAVGAFFAAKFAVDGATIEAVISGIVAAASAIWAATSKQKDVTKVKAAEAVLNQAEMK